MSEQVLPSRFNSLAHISDGSLLIYNSLSGGFGRVLPENAESVRDALRPDRMLELPLSSPLDGLLSAGFLVHSHEGEQRAVDNEYLTKYEESYLNLIIMPTEQCNFRCVYCYETFMRKAMSTETQDGLYRFVAAQEDLQTLDINWFGGEPLLAADVVLSLSRRLQDLSRVRHYKILTAMTTNGYLLNPDLFAKLMHVGLTRYQITLDGLAEQHDCRRPQQGGGGTYETILSNLRAMRDSDADFFVMLRYNFDPQGLTTLEPFLNTLAQDFGSDSRFGTFFHAVGRWGGPNDHELEVCEGRTKAHELIRAQKLAADRGFRDGVMTNQFRPGGFACYAANPRSFVIGSDGQVYKCTVELDAYDRNIVGQLHPSGDMSLDWRKMGLWCETNGRQPGKKCGSCHFSPACHGAVCPKEWMDSRGQDFECPPHKMVIREALPLLQIQRKLSSSPSWVQRPHSPATWRGGD